MPLIAIVSLMQMKRREKVNDQISHVRGYPLVRGLSVRFYNQPFRLKINAQFGGFASFAALPRTFWVSLML